MKRVDPGRWHARAWSSLPRRNGYGVEKSAESHNSRRRAQRPAALIAINSISFVAAPFRSATLRFFLSLSLRARARMQKAVDVREIRNRVRWCN